MGKIMLDAGHYGKYNQSPHVPEYWESKRVWVLMRYLQIELEKKGHLVLTTRDDQSKDLDVYNRGLKAKGYDMFISLHSNDFDGSEDLTKANKVDYVVAYVPSYANNSRCKNSQAFGLKMAQAVKPLIGSVSEARTNTKLNGNKDEWYGVLRGWQKTNCPIGLILEHGFHSNPKTAKWLMDDRNLMELARVEANLIDAQLKGEIATKEEPKTETPATIKVGSIVKIKSGAYKYGTTRKLSSWVYPLNWVVMQIKGDRVVINKSADGKHAIETPVKLSDLTLVK
jgi:N-acetylmuramoyl-L-alanine amidase